jgi:hypothetical protein
VSGVLARLSDDEMVRGLDVAESLGSGIGGGRALIEIGDVPVFVKRVPLTELELTRQGFRSTANLFDLPMACHYGIASPGFSVWREVAANEMTTRLVIDGMAESFPMLYHWRVQEDPLESEAVEALVNEVADYWNGAPTVASRLDALANAPASVLLFFEYIPTTLPSWLDEQASLGTDAADAAIEMVEDGLRSGVDEMELAGLLHFDAHLHNILTDGSRVYFTDFGLATSRRFQLSDSERRFVADNATHDRCHTLTRLLNWIIAALTDAQDWEARDERIERIRDGDPDGIEHLGPTARAVIQRYAPIAAVINDFYRRLRFEDRHALYPTEAVQHALSSQG